MKEYKNIHWMSIPAWFDYSNFYDQAIAKLTDNTIAVELGTWLGGSTCYFAQGIKESGKKITFYACDLFIAPKAEDGDYLKQCPDITNENFYTKFMDNIRKQEVTGFVIPVKVNSLGFAKAFKEKSVDFLFVDDLHTEDHVYKELVAWYPKLKDRAIFAGHDVGHEPIQRALKRFTQERGLPYHRTIGNCWVIDVRKT